jgi:Domain of unknown function (DUF4410)
MEIRGEANSMNGWFVCAVFAMTVLWGCAAEPEPLATEAGVSLAGRTNLAVAPASNDTGQNYDFDVAGALTEDLKSALQAKGYTVSDPKAAPPDALIIQSSLLSYAPGNAAERVVGAGTTETRVKTTAVDKKTGEPVGDLLTTKQVGGSPIALLCPACAVATVAGTIGEDKRILKSVADEVATAIDRRIKGY